jgi:hypothetical protein
VSRVNREEELLTEYRVVPAPHAVNPPPR